MTLNQDSSGSSKIKCHDANQKPMDRFESDIFESNIVSLAIFKIFATKDIIHRRNGND